MRSWIPIAAGGAAVAVAAAVALYLLRRRRPLALPAPEPQANAVTSASDEPISRETRYDEEIDAEERRRHEAAERLRADPLTERLEGENEA